MKEYLNKSAVYLRQNGLLSLAKKVYKKTVRKKIEEEQYQKWIKEHTPGEEELGRQSGEIFSGMPLYSIVVPLYCTPEKYLREMIASVQAQSYQKWELLLADGSGPDSPLKKILIEYRSDSRIKVFLGEKKYDISENTNRLLERVKGDYIVFTDHDDLLAPNALYECTKAISKTGGADLLYSDEDKITMDGRKYFQPHFKSDFNLDLLRSMNYFCHLVVVKKELQQQVGLLRPEFNGAQDYDFVLRCVEKAEKICHIPKVLYHWRAHQGSIAGNAGSKEYAFEAGRRALQEHYARCGIQAEVKKGELFGIYHTSYTTEEKPLVSILIPNKDHVDDLKRCIESVLGKTDYPAYEIIIIENNSVENTTFSYYKELENKDSRIRVVEYADSFNYSKINNFGASHAKGSCYLFLNNDIEVISPEWMDELVGYVMRPGVGIVGARLFYPDGRIQHAGVVVGYRRAAAHVAIGNDGSDAGYFGRTICAQEYSAVTAACMMVKKDCFEEIGGFEEDLQIAYNDVDLCLKAREKGYLVVYNPAVQLYHYESRSRGADITPDKQKRFEKEKYFLRKRWKKFFEKGDPFYNPNLTLKDTLFTLRKK